MLAKKFHMPLAMKAVKVNQTYIDKLQHTGVEDVIYEEHPTLNTVKHYMGEPWVIGHLKLLVTAVFQFVTAGKKIEADTIPYLCRMIIEDYDWLSMADIKLCFKRGIKGKYGSDYDRVDAPILFGWLEQYRAQRLRTSEELKRLQKKENEGNWVAMPDEIKQKMNEMEKNMQIKSVKKKVKQEVVDWEAENEARLAKIREQQEILLSQVNQER